VSSIKGNIGHCEAASGAAALAKLILMMRAKRIPPQANLRNLNLKLVGQLGSGILITDKMIQWQPSSRSPRRALLNNFGAAGSNAALLLEEAEAFGHSDATETASPWPSYVFNLSAKSRDALSRQIVAYGHFLSNDGANATPLDIFYGSTTRRQVYDYRISIQFSSIEDLRSSLSTTDVSSLLPAKKKSKVVFVFSGQGGTHPGMGADLLQTLTEFRNIIDDADAYLLSLGFESILPYITGSLRSEDGIISNCACIALQYAIARLMMRMNIQPDVLIGHRYAS
jgi:acyl transferase domain-containing protein